MNRVVDVLQICRTQRATTAFATELRHPLKLGDALRVAAKELEIHRDLHDILKMELSVLIAFLLTITTAMDKLVAASNS